MKLVWQFTLVLAIVGGFGSCKIFGRHRGSINLILNQAQSLMYDSQKCYCSALSDIAIKFQQLAHPFVSTCNECILSISSNGPVLSSTADLEKNLTTNINMISSLSCFFKIYMDNTNKYGLGDRRITRADLNNCLAEDINTEASCLTGGHSPADGLVAYTKNLQSKVKIIRMFSGTETLESNTGSQHTNKNAFLGYSLSDITRMFCHTQMNIAYILNQLLGRF